jgi:hypothetical protein
MGRSKEAGRPGHRLIKIPRCVLSGFLLGLCVYSGGNVKDLASSIPAKVLDWKASGKDMVYNRQTLYDYMDGGAEVYLAFDYREVFVRKFTDSAKNEITLDIYDMGSSREAFGIFSCDRQDPEAGIGQDSEYGPGLLKFWQGRYFVSITVSGDERIAEKAVLELGKALAPRLGPAGEPSDLLNCLPSSGLKKNRTSYFHNAVHLSNRYFVAAENILNLDAATECVFAEYAAGVNQSASLLLVRYPDAAKAQTAGQSFRRAYIPEADASGAALTENKKWVMAKIRGNFVAIVFEAPSKEYADALQSAVRFPSQ